VSIQTSTDGSTWTALANVPEFSQAPGDANYVHNTTVDFGGVLAKYVKLTITSNWADGTKQAGLSEVRFFYVPVRARQPEPASGATGVALNGVLNWRPGREAARHEVYVGTDPNAVLNGTAPVKTVTEHSLGLSSLAAEYGRTYYWKVNEVNDAATPTSWEGAVWSFTTVEYAVVEDFESYDDLCNRIFWTWVDQYGYNASAECGGAGAPGNGSGATVGNAQAPYAEQAIVHSGRQSLPITFDNTGSPYYSEAQREWSSPQAWTAGGANTLRVYLRGDPAAFIETPSGTILMNGMGTDIWDISDQFRFVYKSLKGNGSIVARVDSVANTNVWAKAGVMIRESLAGGSTHESVVVTPGSGVSFQHRDTTDMTSLSTTQAGSVAPYWVKMTRNGNTFTAQCSADGVTWTSVGTDAAASSATITMANDVYIGLAVCSHVVDVACGAKFSSVSSTGGVSGSWQVAEIGVGQVQGNKPETFYVAVQDNAGKLKVVSHPDPAVIATGNWEEWNIPLSQFSSAGVSLNNVKKLIVGVGDRLSPKAGNAGKLYIDDIRLTRVSP
jgi:regulation of enolase protein 1 (concanavalin A-like superfamily)